MVTAAICCTNFLATPSTSHSINSVATNCKLRNQCLSNVSPGVMALQPPACDKRNIAWSARRYSRCGAIVHDNRNNCCERPYGNPVRLGRRTDDTADMSRAHRFPRRYDGKLHSFPSRARYGDRGQRPRYRRAMVTPWPQPTRCLRAARRTEKYTGSLWRSTQFLCQANSSTSVTSAMIVAATIARAIHKRIIASSNPVENFEVHAAERYA